MEFGYWGKTLTRWHEEGLPKKVDGSIAVERYFGLEGFELLPYVPAANYIFPPFELKVLEDRGNTRIVRDLEGNICEQPKDYSSISRYIEYGIKDKKDWEIYRNEYLDPKNAERIGEVKEAVAQAHGDGLPIRFVAGSLYGKLRNWMGMESISVALMLERDWIEEMMEHLTQLTLYLIEEALADVQADFAWWWEDMCFNHGPLMSPRLFEELMVPRYKRITDALKSRGTDVNILDCDGNIYELVPGWLRGGINCMFPIEMAHTDPVVLREKFRQSVLLVGGVNKVELAKGREAIDRELERLRPLVEAGGYIPTVDHRVPPDVSFENYSYYMEKKKEIL
jgi:uroporphyrinogen decarboxylase